MREAGLVMSCRATEVAAPSMIRWCCRRSCRRSTTTSRAPNPLAKTTQARQAVPGVRLFDAHTHLGQNDPDGMKQTPAELLQVLADADAIGAAGAFTFPMHELAGSLAANDMVIAAAAASAGRLIPFCRVSPVTGNAPDEAPHAPSTLSRAMVDPRGPGAPGAIASERHRRRNVPRSRRSF